MGATCGIPNAWNGSASPTTRSVGAPCGPKSSRCGRPRSLSPARHCDDTRQPSVMRSNARHGRAALCALGAILLWSAPARAASWEAVTEATERLGRGDYGGALRLLDDV